MIAINDAMIDRALRAMYGDMYVDSWDADWRVEKEHEMRQILIAALRTISQPPEEPS